jgi:hypothetical protein
MTLGQTGNMVRGGEESGPGTVPEAAVKLYWVPLGARQRSLSVSGKVFEAISALVHRRSRCDMYHSAVEIVLPDGRYVIELTAVPDLHGSQRGVVGEGPVGSRWAGHVRRLRYEIRCGPNGVLSGANLPSSAPVRMTADTASAERVLEMVPGVPHLAWGRDEIHAGDIWNSNSVVSWLLDSSGIDVGGVETPAVGRAPGWQAGLTAARRLPPTRPSQRVSYRPSGRHRGRLPSRTTCSRSTASAKKGGPAPVPVVRLSRCEWREWKREPP